MISEGTGFVGRLMSRTSPPTSHVRSKKNIMVRVWAAPMQEDHPTASRVLSDHYQRGELHLHARFLLRLPLRANYRRFLSRLRLHYLRRPIPGPHRQRDSRKIRSPTSKYFMHDILPHENLSLAVGQKPCHFFLPEA